MREISVDKVRADLIARREIALIDLREEAAFAEAHPLFAAQLSLSRLELDVLDRIPRRTTRIVVYDDGEGLVGQAIPRLQALGYDNVHALAGGLAGWRAAGLELFQDVNSYSKAFGELVEHRRHTPSLSAEEVRSLIDAGENMVILDARRFEEYQVMSIPGAVSVPGAELVLRARQLAPDPSTRIVVNCAGRTRSLIGTQSLINARLPNRIDALRNGTIGWTLAGLTLEHGQSRRFDEADPVQLAEARARSREVAYRAGVRRIGPDEVADLIADEDRTLYRFDVRTPEEYAAGHLPGFRSAPGGQLVQEVDMFAPVRGARMLLADELGPRADMTASWLAQMGWDVLILNGNPEADLVQGPWRPTYPPLPDVNKVAADELMHMDAVVVDLASSAAYRKGHIPGAYFSIRSRLADDLVSLPPGKLVLTSPDGALAKLAAHEIAALGTHDVSALAGGTNAWIARGGDMETGMQQALCPPLDIYRRPYEGTDNSAAAMQAYLDWEYGLVAQLEKDGTHGFIVI